MNAELSLAHLILQASGLVQIVMALLLLASVLSWAVILGKRTLLNRTRKEADRFEERFWSGGKLSELHEHLQRGKSSEGQVAIFKAGYEEFLRQRQHQGDADDALISVQRALRVTHVREVERLEGGLAMLATIGSTSPYVGLFGTVWGIMNAFVEIAEQQNTSLAVVAPGIAEALLATGLGLLAAIPAVIFYNKLSADADRILSGYESFADEFATILSRQLDS